MWKWCSHERLKYTTVTTVLIPHDNSTVSSRPTQYGTILLATMTKCCQPFHRGLLLLLAWNMLIDFYNEFIINVSFELLYTSLSSDLKGWLIPFSVLSVLLPIVGWVGDSLLGRYQAIIAGFFLLTVAFLTFLSAFVMLQLNWTQIPAIIIMCVSQLMNLFGLGSIYTNMLHSW